MKKHIALLCAAGIGQRMKSNVPKQYLTLLYQNIEQTIIEITVKKFLDNSKIDAVIVALNQQDTYFTNLYSNWFIGKNSLQYQHQTNHQTLYPTSNKKLFYCFGFGLRFHTVYSLVTNALLLVSNNNWNLNEVVVHIHDVARPGIKASEIDELVQQSQKIKSFTDTELINEHNLAVSNEFYGILPINRVVDTVRMIEADQNQITVKSTIDRNSVALALTPQSLNLLYYSILLHTILVEGQDQEYITNQDLKIFPDITAFISKFTNIVELVKNQLNQSNIGYNKKALLSDKCKQILATLTDDIGLLLHINLPVHAIEFGRNNIKITCPEDLPLAQYYLSQE